MLKISLLFKESYKLHEQITRELLGLRMQNVQGIAFVRTQIDRDIFKSGLVYLTKAFRCCSQ